jgi:integrase/recombinase XerD
MPTRRFCTPFPPFDFMDIRFWLRRSKKAGQPGTVYCTLTTGGIEAVPFSTGISAWPPAEKDQRPTPRSWQGSPIQRLAGDTPDVQADNDTLTTLYQRLRSLRTELETKGLPCDANSVSEALKAFGKAAPSLLEAAHLFVAAREKQVRPADAPAWDKSGFSQATIDKYHVRLGLLKEYLKKAQHLHMPLAKFTAKHADSLVELIVTRPAQAGRYAGAAKGKGGAEYAGKVVGWVSQVLDYAINQEWLAVNPLSAWTPPRTFEKELIYLEIEQVAELAAYKFANPYLQRIADAFLFCCWTGLAWADLNAFSQAHVSDSRWLSMLRAKTGTAFNFPLLPEAEQMLKKYSETGLPCYENQPMNRGLKEIASLLGWANPQEYTHHAARRTFGMFLLNEDVPIETVAAVLGHKNVRTTQRYYARFIERRKIARDFLALKARREARERGDDQQAA